MKQLRKYLNFALNALAGGSFLAMVLLTCWQVFTRYILRNPSTWSEEMVSYLFAWMSLFGASLVVGERGHMNIPIVVERFGDKARKFFAITLVSLRSARCILWRVFLQESFWCTAESRLQAWQWGR